MDLLHAIQLLVRDPRLGVPLLLFYVALLAWIIAAPRGQPRERGFDPPVPVPDRDPVSRTVLALHEEAYSAILLEAFDRLDVELRARRGVALDEVDRPRRGAPRLRREERRTLRRLADRLTRLHLYALQLESGGYLRWDFWRSVESARRRFFKRFDSLLGEVDRALTSLASTP